MINITDTMSREEYAAKSIKIMKNIEETDPDLYFILDNLTDIVYLLIKDIMDLKNKLKELEK